MSGITLEGKLLMVEKDGAFKGPEEVVSFLKSTPYAGCRASSW